MKKLLAILLGIMIVLSVTFPAAAISNTTKSTSKVKPITLTVEVFDRANAPAGAGAASMNYLTNLIQKTWGTPNNVNLKYIPVQRSAEIEYLNLLIAAGAQPNISFTYTKDLYLRFANQGGLADLTSYIDKTTYLKPLMEKMKSDIMYKGKYFAATAYRTLADQQNMYLRTDLLKKYNITQPTTADEFYAMLKTLKQKDPSCIPYGLMNSPAGSEDNADGASMIIRSFVKANDEQVQTLPYLSLPGYRDGVKFVNKMYNDGLVDPDFALDQGNRNFFANITNGKIACFFENTDGAISPYVQPSQLEVLQKNVSTATIDPVELIKNSDGKYLKMVNPRTGWFIMVSKKSKPEQIQAAVDYMDWQASPVGAKLLMWGEEGRNYNLVDGIPTVSAAQATINKKDRFNFADLSLMWSGTYNTDEDLILKTVEALNPTTGKQQAAAKKFALRDSYRDYARNPAFDTIITAAKNQTNLNKMFLDGLAKLIMAKPADFDKLYDTLLADYLKNGGQDIIDQKIAAYKTMH